MCLAIMEAMLAATSRHEAAPQSAPSDPRPAPALGPGRLFGAHYRLVRSIGKGGMGEVFSAECLRTRRVVAVKVLAHELVAQPDWVARFRHEGRCVARLRHPNVVALLDEGTDIETGLPYLVFEHLRGETLATHLARHGRLTLERAVATLVPVLSALEATHGARVIHRDVKPANVVLVPGRVGAVPVLIDYGLALAEGEVFDDPTAVEHGAPVGTPLYMSPEQARGVDGVDARSDVWAAGVLLFEMLSGRTPVVGRDVLAVLSQISTRPAPRIEWFVPEVPPAVAEVLARALAFDPMQHFSTVGEFRRALRRALEAPVPQPATDARPRLRTGERPTARYPSMNNLNAVPATAVWASPVAPSRLRAVARRAENRVALLCALLALVVAFMAGLHEALAAEPGARERLPEPPPCAMREQRAARARCIPSRNAVHPPQRVQPR